MQVAGSQAVRAFAALRVGRRRGAARRRRVRPTSAVSPLTLDRALTVVGETPAVRPGAVAQARHRVIRGERPTGDQVAEMVIRRSVCDRLG